MELNKNDLEFIKMLVDYEIRNQRYTYQQKGKLNKLQKKLVKILNIPVVESVCVHDWIGATQIHSKCTKCGAMVRDD